MRPNRSMFVGFSLLLVGLIGCGNNHNPRVVDGPTTTQTSVAATSYTLDASAFALDTVVGLVKSGQISDTAALEKTVNDPSTGINNVDVDNDGKIDFIGVQEGSDGSKVVLNLLAVPSSTGDVNAAVKVASVTVEKDIITNQVTISGGYPEYVSGYDRYYYHDTGLSFGEAYLIASLLRPHPVYAYHYNPYYYTPRYVVPPTTLSTTRTSYTTTNKVTTVSPVSRSTTVNVGSNNTTYASKSSSSSSNKTTSTTMSGYSGSMTSYSVTDPSKKSQTVSAFSSTPTTTTSTAAKTTAAATKPATSTSSSWGSSSSTTSKPTSSSGSSSSWWGSSSSSSSSKSSGSSKSKSSSSRRR